MTRVRHKCRKRVDADCLARCCSENTETLSEDQTLTLVFALEHLTRDLDAVNESFLSVGVAHVVLDGAYAQV